MVSIHLTIVGILPNSDRLLFLRTVDWPHHKCFVDGLRAPIDGVRVFLQHTRLTPPSHRRRQPYRTEPSKLPVDRAINRLVI